MKNIAQKIFRAEVWMISVAVHVAAICLVLFVPAVQDFLFKGKDPGELVVSEGRLQNILREMLDLNSQKATRMISEMAGQSAVMNDISKRQLDRLQEARQQPVNLPRYTSTTESLVVRQGMSFDALYELARQIELRMVEEYKAIRALGMAVVRPELTVQEALDSTTVMNPARPVLDADVFALPISRDDTERLDLFRSELRRVGKELESIAAYSAKLLEFAMDIDAHADGMTMNLFMEDSDIFTGGYRGPTLMPDEIYDTHSFSMGSFAPIAGRVIAADGDPSMWLFVDTWHIIGPFPNERRRALDTRFGPEAGIDLDATYIGKDGQELRWDYYRSDTLKIEPRFVDRYVIYYGYTEVYSERDQDVWLSTGTDDHGKIWINGEHIWTSPTEPKPFKADEHVQIVRLRQGYNEILVRCENAGGTMGWCLLFCTIPAD